MPIFIFAYVYFVSETAGCARFVVSVVVLPLVGYSSLDCFGSWWWVPIGLVVYLVFSLLILQLLSSLALRRPSYR